jgi:hypothetical protein
MTSLINAFAYAEHKHRPLNTFVTLLWDDISRVSGKPIQQLITEFTRKLNKWTRDNLQEKAHYLYVNEWQPSKGNRNSKRGVHHSHFLIHVPPDKITDFLRRLPGMVPHVRYAPANAIDVRGSQLINHELDYDLSPGNILASLSKHRIEHHIPRHNISSRMGLMKYLLKGGDRKATVLLDGEDYNFMQKIGVEPRGKQGSFQDLRRYGISEALGRKARSEHGWRERTAVAELWNLLNNDMQPWIFRRAA